MANSTTRLNNNYILGLDIGTRSIVGIVGYAVDTGFHVMAYAMKEHETRAMIDGQIHDVDKVTKTIVEVKTLLEEQLGVKLHKACIAAAGRVLKTATIHVEQETDPMTLISDDQVNALELLGMEEARRQVNSDLATYEMGYHCVGYSVSKYYINDYEITSLKDHKGKKIGADVLATFLPEEVIESLYLVVKNAGLEVYSLTLEPIAAIEVAIPERFRLLNIALIDIGAGTSDIAITKSGSVIAYGMIPKAGDEMTEAIAHKYLVDFNNAEQIKRQACSKIKKITFNDIIGIEHTVKSSEIIQVLKKATKEITREIGEKIIKLNNGNATNAVFIVGGGSQVEGLTDQISSVLGIDKNRVAIRGEEVLSEVDFGKLLLRKGPELVTPIGICLTGLINNRQDFIKVYFDDEPIPLYDNNQLTIMDVAAYKGVNPTKLLATRGKDLVFILNGQENRVSGEVGNPAIIKLNDKKASLSTPIAMNDAITIVEAARGLDAHCTTHGLLENLDLKVYFRDEGYPLKPQIYVNEICLEKDVAIQEDDEVRLKLPSLKDFLTQNKLDQVKYCYYINGSRAENNGSLADLDYLTRKRIKPSGAQTT